MPELPEVETTIQGLKTRALNGVFVDFWTDSPNILKGKTSGEFRKIIKNKKIKDIRRKGKNIIFSLSGSWSLLIHQKMSGHLLRGKWRYENGKWFYPQNGPIKDDPINSYIHLVLFLKSGEQIALPDIRKFAKVMLGKNKEIQEELKDVAPDPFEITEEKFIERIKNKKGKIKTALMKQSVVSGIGNIYSDEVLFLSKIHPERVIKDLAREEIGRIYKNAKKILREAIKEKGTSVSDYRDIEGRRGEYGRRLKVYRKEGQKCLNCGEEIKRKKVNSRSAHFCSKCQK